jgi:hypothetical protein
VVLATLQCPPQIKHGSDDWGIELALTYQGVAGEAPGTVEGTSRSITFCKPSFLGLQGPRLDRLIEVTPDNGLDADVWERCDTNDNGCGGYLFVDVIEDMLVRIGHDDNNFSCLAPGETITVGRFEGVEDAEPGDRFRCRWKGAAVSWWDWGTMQDYVETMVTLSGFDGSKVIEPADNSGRPKLVVPGTAYVEFVIE